jgi:hypothetical protein
MSLDKNLLSYRDSGSESESDWDVESTELDEAHGMNDIMTGES